MIFVRHALALSIRCLPEVKVTGSKLSEPNERLFKLADTISMETLALWGKFDAWNGKDAIRHIVTVMPCLARADGRIKGRSIVNVLIEQLKSIDRNVRESARPLLRVLGRPIATPKILTTLVEMLHSPVLDARNESVFYSWRIRAASSHT
jgi:hypothetical protein